MVFTLGVVMTTSNTPAHANTQPDLKVGTPSVDDARLWAGPLFPLSVIVTNAGGLGVGGDDARLLSFDRCDDYEFGHGAGLRGGRRVRGGRHPQPLEVRRSPFEAGTYYYGAYVDSLTGESDITYNCSSSYGWVVPIPLNLSRSLTRVTDCGELYQGLSGLSSLAARLDAPNGSVRRVSTMKRTLAKWRRPVLRRI